MVKPKRILLLNWRDMRHTEAGGAEVYAYELARRWVQAGHSVQMFCGNDGHSPRHEVIDGINITRRGGFNFVYAWAMLYYFTKFRKQTDVIVDCHNGIPFFTPFYSRKPIYCVVHHVHQEVFKQYMSRGPALLASFLERVVMPFAYRKRQFITVSESSKQGMIETLGIPADHIAIVHNGIDLEHFKPGKKVKDPTILYLGRLKAYKSVDVLIRAFAEVLKKQPNAKLVIGGTGDAEPDLKKLTEQLHLEKHITFHGYVSEADKVRLMQEAWVFCSPSYAEGWGITIIEANACGTPVIASDVAGLQESVNAPESGFLEPYGNVSAFAERLIYILHDKKVRDRMSKQARSWASRFNWQDSADTFLNDHLIGKSGSKPAVIISSYDDIKNPFYAGGGAISISEVAGRLSGDFNLTILTGNYPGAKDLILNSVRYKRIGPSFAGPKLGQLLFHFILPFYVRKLDFDLWIENLTPPFSTSCLQLYTKKPVIGLVHMLAAEDMQRKYKLPFHYIENLGLKTYHYFIAPTEVTIAKLANLRQQPKTFVIPNGVTPPEEKAAKTGAERFILFIGRLEVNQKGLDLLIKAYQELLEKQQMKLIIAGTGIVSEEKKLRALIHEHRLEQYISLAGRVEGHRKWDLLQQCALVVAPSRLETFGIVALEAMVCGKPVVTFDIPGFQWLPADASLKAKAFDTHDLSRAMEYILSNKRAETTMGAAAKEAASSYSWTNVTGQYRQAINDVLKQGADA